MPLKHLKITVDVEYRKGAEVMRFRRSGRFDVTGEEVKRGRTICTGAGQTVLSQNDELSLDRAIFFYHNAGDGNILLDIYDSGSAILAAQKRIKPGESGGFRLPNSTNAADIVKATLASGTTGLLLWMVVEDPS